MENLVDMKFTRREILPTGNSGRKFADGTFFRRGNLAQRPMCSIFDFKYIEIHLKLKAFDLPLEEGRMGAWFC